MNFICFSQEVWENFQSVKTPVIASRNQWLLAAVLSDLLLLMLPFVNYISPSKCQNVVWDSWILAAGHSKYTQMPFYLKFLSKNNQVVEPQRNNTQFKFWFQVAHWCLRTGNLESGFWHKRPVLLWGTNYSHPVASNIKAYAKANSIYINTLVYLLRLFYKSLFIVIAFISTF